ncbi:cytochrome ubiquinol oxidase subunit I [Adlercreutzia sp. ZJ304]|uniref:cytochrome ubiquinol oxidase subunit I n=1 Tax=Adlercreutzia sp. ZJ304 TaxID=2709791 RepID=UPI0013ED65CB|nr:cytochrome ubiquinol oxidase subunit I [Adlercreutzia sp. ZJ304]
MDLFADQVLMSRIQFALTASYHFIFVPITIGIGLLMAIFVTRAYRSRKPEDDAIARMWVRIFTATFAIGVATGITMEFSFGTNWANYSRFVGDIFGAPLAAEALFAFFLESIFLGILIFGRNKIKPILYAVSAWLTFAGSALSALWILIANSWMQTPAGAEISADGTQAVITDFFAAAFNPSTLVRYGHTVLAVLVMGAFVAIAVSAWYMHKKQHESAARKILRTSSIVGIIAVVALLGSAHASAVVVWEEQPTKLAMMEGMYETEVPELSVVGIVDEEAQQANTLAIPGGTSFLATGTWDTEYPGLNDLAKTDQFADVDVDTMPVNFVYQVYHLMVACFGLIFVCVLLALIFNRKAANRNVTNMKWLQWLLIISPIFPFLAIQSGWLTAEVGRQPYVVYPSMSGPDGVYMLTQAGTSVSVQPFELVITLVLFFLVYLMLFVGWVRVVGKFIKAGPVYDSASAEAGSAEAGEANNIANAGSADELKVAVPAETTAERGGE